MSKQIKNSAKSLPKPLKPLKRIEPGNVVAVIRKRRDSDRKSTALEDIELNAIADVRLKDGKRSVRLKLNEL